jgi:hypothetical protein
MTIIKWLFHDRKKELNRKFNLYKNKYKDKFRLVKDGNGNYHIEQWVAPPKSEMQGFWLGHRSRSDFENNTNNIKVAKKQFIKTCIEYEHEQKTKIIEVV